MVDINKYLESQLALAKQRSEYKDKKKEAVSLKSRTAAEKISKKQSHSCKINIKTTRKGQNEKKISKSQSIVSAKDSDEEYLPSEIEEDDEQVTFSNVSRTKQNTKKIIDDGDKVFYNDRIKNWCKNLEEVCADNFCGIPNTADVQYVLNGNKDVKENHELQNGFLVPNYIWKQMYKFQRTGVKWLWELHQLQSGGLLGDEMGLGKTIQIIAFLAGLSKTSSGPWNGLGPSIIIAPATVIYQWVLHFHYWFPQIRIAVLHHTGSHMGTHNKLVRDLYNSHGILLMTYAGVMKYHKTLLEKKWHYIILDEGHKIRNPDTQVSKSVKKFETPHRLIITGSPMQNSLIELWSLFDFMRPGLLGTYTAFMEHFALPITQGGYANATEYQEATALEIAKALRALITPYMLRRTKAEVQEHIKLPEKKEQVLFCALSREQRDLYMGYLMSSTIRSVLDKDNKYGDPLRARILVALSTLRKICNHPDLYLYEAQEDYEQIDVDHFGHWKRSGKMTVVNSLLKIWQKQGHRTLIFSQSRAMLCILEQYLQNQQFKYLKMDGFVNVGQRQNLIKTFNENTEYMVFLATTRVGGLGVNLTGADRVIIYDPDWNPATDDQAKERAWRIGQERNVTVYRLLSAGTIEEKIYQRQIFKHFLSNKILIDPHQKNVLTTSTLQSLFNFEEPNHEGDTETATLFKHTKVNVEKNRKKKNSDMQSCSISSAGSVLKNKLETMRKRAKEISEKISKNVIKQKENNIVRDSREEYKKKRELLLNPPKIEKPEVNLVDDEVTNIPFDTILSELDIVNMHVKNNYEENLLKEILTSPNEGEQLNETNVAVEVTNQTNSNNNNSGNTILEDLEKEDSEKICNSKHNEGHKARKRKHSSVPDYKIENLVAIKKVKEQKKKKKDIKYNDDDYVLSKLFAKATVKNALQHDIVVGLAEKEKKHRIKEEAAKRAADAVRAIKFSTK